jgi:hypothetical protein
MECVPTDNELVLNVACAPLRATVGIKGVAASKNVTVPVGVPAAVDATVAVSVTLWPKEDWFDDEVSVVVVGALLTTSVTEAVAVE